MDVRDIKVHLIFFLGYRPFLRKYKMNTSNLATKSTDSGLA
jgi:hypothetical protein